MYVYEIVCTRTKSVNNIINIVISHFTAKYSNPRLAIIPTIKVNIRFIF